MKILKTSDITSSIELYFTKPSVDHLQESYKEALASIIKSMIDVVTSDVVVLYGCVITGGDPGARAYTAGAIYYQGEIYEVVAGGFTTTGSNIPVWTIEEQAGTGDPAPFTDGTPRNVHISRRFVLKSGPIGGSGIPGYVSDYNSLSIKRFPKFFFDNEWRELPTFNAGYTKSGAYPPKFKVNQNGKIEFKGNVTYSSPAGSDIFTLDSGQIPNRPIILVTYDTSVVVDSYILYVNPVGIDGKVRALKQSGGILTGIGTISLDGLSYYLS